MAFGAYSNECHYGGVLSSLGDVRHETPHGGSKGAEAKLHMVVVRALKRRQSRCQVSVVHPREGNTFATGVENEVKKYDVDVSVKIPHANWLRFSQKA